MRLSFISSTGDDGSVVLTITLRPGGDDRVRTLAALEDCLARTQKAIGLYSVMASKRTMGPMGIPGSQGDAERMAQGIMRRLSKRDIMDAPISDFVEFLKASEVGGVVQVDLGDGCGGP